MDDVIQLICAEYAKDEYGVDRPSESCREVFARVESVSRSEFFEGGRNGLNPEYKFTVFAGDYNGERVVIYNGNRYGVYRTYQTTGDYTVVRNGRSRASDAYSDYVELYAERKGGTNG